MRVSTLFFYGRKEKVYLPKFYSNKLEIHGIENIDRNISSIYVVNHSNVHDILSIYIIMRKLNIPISVLVSDDALNYFSKSIFSMAAATFLDRNDKKSSSNSILEASAQILAGKSVVIFGEATWNIHPTRLCTK